MTGNILAAVTVLGLNGVLAGLVRALPRHRLLVSLCWAVGVIALVRFVPPIWELASHC